MTASSPSARLSRRSTAAGVGATAFSSGTRPRTRGFSGHPPSRAIAKALSGSATGRRGAQRRARELPPASGANGRPPLDIYGVRYPGHALGKLRQYGARYRGWLPNAKRRRSSRAILRRRTCRALLCRPAPRHPDHPRLRGPRLRHLSSARRGATPKGCSGRARTICRARRSRNGAPSRGAARRCRLAHPSPKTALPPSAPATPARIAPESFSPWWKRLRRPPARRSLHEDRLLRLEPGVVLLERRRDLLPGLLSDLLRRGHRIVFYEPDAFDRQKHRDIDPPTGAESASIPRPTKRCAPSSPKPPRPMWW